jgi:rubrerythrin
MTNTDASSQTEDRLDEQEDVRDKRSVYFCDRCGFEMIDRHCKVVCPNCGARWDCSDLNIYTD